jgi:hypothetical protein
MATRAQIVNAIAAIQLDIVGVNEHAVYGPGGLGAPDGVKEIPDDISVSLPAFLLLDGDEEIITNPRERQTWTLEGTVWVEYSPRGERYRQLVDLREPIQAAFRAKSKGNLAVHADPDVQSAVLTGFGRVDGRQWNRGTPEAPGAWYLVLPYSIEVKVNRTVTYLPA